VEDRRFDEIAKRFGEGNSRRAVLARLGAGLAAALAGALGARQEVAARRAPPVCGRNKPCPTDPNSVCAENRCVGEGTNAACVLVPRNTGQVCSRARTACELDARCVGTTCPANPFAPATTECRAAAGPCDLPEFCTGTSNACPTNQFVQAGTVCRTASAACEGPALCSGTGAACPNNPFLPATTLCRRGVGGCDVSEFCTGNSATCPADVTTPCGGAPNSDTICCKVGRQAGRCVAPQACPAGVRSQRRQRQRQRQQ